MVSFFSALKNFFKKFFSKQASKSSEKELALSEILPFLKSASQSEKDFLDSLVAKKFSEIKHILRQLESLLQKLESAEVETENAKLEKIVETSRRHSSQQLSMLVQKLSPPNLQDLRAVRKYCLESESFLNKEIPSFGKSLVYTSIVLKEDMKNIGSLVGELQKNFAELNREFGKNKKVFLEQFANEKIRQISLNNNKILSIKETIASLGTEIFGLEKIVSESESEIGGMRSSAEAKAIVSLGEKKSSLWESKKALEEEIFGKISTVEKPLKKLANIAEKQKTSLSREQSAFLQDFLHNPVLALKRDPKGELFKAVLRELDSQFSSGNLELKEKDFEKKQAALKELLEYDFFENFFWKANSIEIGLQKIEKELRQSDFSKKLFEAQKELKEKQLLLAEKKARLSAEKKDLDSLDAENSALKLEITSAFSGSFEGQAMVISG
ncbi:MAG: hypothetical protein PHD95_02250 [Candidatus ainarchaeum sp.]|nr:hypothetical protein [Candidatus ainarchaeum sp.]